MEPSAEGSGLFSTGSWPVTCTYLSMEHKLINMKLAAVHLEGDCQHMAVY